MAKNILKGDEGMWPLNMVPKDRIKKLHKISLNDQWLEHVQKASVRMNNGGSASFVSSDGLLVTNHHVGASILYELSSEKKDYFKDGFLAKTRRQEAKAPQLEVNVLWEIEDVTERVVEAVSSVVSKKTAVKKRRAIIAKIEEESKKKTGMRSDVITLYNGGLYHLYRYKRYTDIRLVFAPEAAIASYGGDIDNYEYPRYSLDFTFFRVYENGKPLHTPHHFSWSTEPPKMNQTLFISGHPGSTDRLTTHARLKHMRDKGMILLMQHMYRKEVLLQQFAGRSPEHLRRAKDDLHSIQNVRKRFEGQLAAIQSPHFFEILEKREHTIRAAIAQKPVLKKSTGSAWKDVEGATQYFDKNRDEYLLFEGARGFSCWYFHTARTIVRLVHEDKKPNTERLEEYGMARRDSLLESLYSPAPVYADLEEHKFTDALRILLETLGADDVFVRKILGNKNVEEVARTYVARTNLQTVSVRKKLITGGIKAVRASKDPFIQLALEIDKRSRAIREKIDEHVDEVIEDAYARISRALFQLYGKQMYPDATFTLRLAYGQVLPYAKDRVPEQMFTTIGGIFKHGSLHNYEGAWKLPESWKKKEKVLKKDRSAFTIITNHDTHGGNSGSPIFTKNLEIVGLLFDGLTHTQGDTFMYMDSVPEHSVSVHTQGIYSVLEKVYGADNLIRELKG